MFLWLRFIFLFDSNNCVKYCIFFPPSSCTIQPESSPLVPDENSHTKFLIHFSLEVWISSLMVFKGVFTSFSVSVSHAKHISINQMVLFGINMFDTLHSHFTWKAVKLDNSCLHVWHINNISEIYMFKNVQYTNGNKTHTSW